MPNILSVLYADGNTYLGFEEVFGISQPVVNFDITYSNEGGFGIRELTIRNETTNMNANNITISSPVLPIPEGSSGETNSTLNQLWDFKPVGSEAWRNNWSTEIIIPVIPPGRFVQVRSKVELGEGVEPVTHRGSIVIDYLRSSV